MRTVGYQYLVKMKVKLSREEVEQLYKDSQRHYDSHCKAVGVPGPGSFLHAMRVMLGTAGESLPQHDEVEYALNFREIDTLCKICEVTDDQAGERIYMQLRQFLGYLSQECSRGLSLLAEPGLDNETCAG